MRSRPNGGWDVPELYQTGTSVESQGKKWSKAMLKKIKFICTLATFVLAVLTALLATILGVRLLAAGPFERGGRP